MKPNRTILAFLSSHLGIISVSFLGFSGMVGAQTWTNTTSGTSNWSVASNWSTDPAAPVSGTTTGIQFFATPATVIPAASAIVANQDIATPMILNSLVVNGTGPATGTAPSLTISGGTLQFDGTTPSLSLNPAFGTVGYTVNLSAPLNFNAPTSISFGSGGGTINTGGAWNGAGAVTFTGSLGNRPLSLTTATGTTFTGDLFLTGNSNTVLQLNAVTGALGANAATTQAVVVNTNAGVNINYGNGAFNNQQNFVISGNGNASTTNAAVNITRINFGNCTIGGIAAAADTTFRIAMENAGDARIVSATRGLVGSGKLIKTGNGYLQPSVTSPASVTWGGTEYNAFTGNVEVRQGALQTPANQPNSLGSNAATTQRVTISSGAAFSFAAGNNASIQPQNFILNGSGTGYAANVGGLAALDSFGAGFGNNTVRRIVVATDSTISARRDASSSGLGRGLTTQAGLAGTGTLTINGPYGTAISPVYLSQAASAFEEFPAFSGKVIINNGILNIGNTDALGTSPVGQVTLNNLGALSSSLAGGLDQAFLDRIENLATTGGAVCLGNASANDLDFSSAANLRLGAINSFTYSGTLTPAGSVYRLGGGGGTLTVSSQLTGSNSVVVSGSVILGNAANDFNGGVTIASHNTGLGQTAALGFTGGTGSLNGNAINFGGAGGTLAYTGGATGSSDSLGALSFPTGHSNVTSTKGAAGNTFLTFSSMAARAAGATGNFTVSGGTNGTDNKITVTGLATGFVDKGLFFGDFNYAYNDAAGFLRAPVYGTDAGFVTSAAATSLASATHQNISGSISAQTSAAFTTFKIAGAFGVTMAADQVLTVDGILKSGGNAGTISGTGTAAIRASSGSEMVIRSQASGDGLTISVPILANGASSLTKTGAGSLTLSAANTYTGATTVVAGTLTVASTGSLEDSVAVTVNGGTYSTNSTTDTVGTVTLKNGVIGGIGIHQGSSYEVENGMVTGRLGGSGGLTKTTAGQVVLAGANSYSGATTISGGTLSVSYSGSLSDFTSVILENGATYELGGSDSVGDVALIDGTIRGPGALDGLSYDVRSGRIEAPLAGTGTLTKSTAGTVTLAGINTLLGEIQVDAGTLELADNARLAFAVSGTSTTNSIGGTGTVTFAGDFDIDLTSGSPDLTAGNEWLLVNPALNESYGATFSVVGFTAKPDGLTWTRTVGANQWTFSETTGKLSVGPAGFAAWADANNVLEGENGDDDKDGVINLVEYALGLDPQVSTVPAGTFVGNLLTFVKGPEAKAAGDVTYSIETSTSLDTGSWTPAAAIETADDISFALPPNQPGGKLFARLKVVK